jgi:hypothetical protein
MVTEAITVSQLGRANIIPFLGEARILTKSTRERINNSRKGTKAQGYAKKAGLVCALGDFVSLRTGLKLNRTEGQASRLSAASHKGCPTSPR